MPASRRSRPDVTALPAASGSVPGLVGTPGPPLLASGDPSLAEALTEVASVAGVDSELATDAAGLHRCWSSAGLVLLGVDLADEAGGLPRRPGVVLVGHEPVATLDGTRTEGGLWDLAVQLGAEQLAMLPGARSWLVDRLARTSETERGAPVVGVVGGRGGAGASSFAAALAVTAARVGHPVALVDLDPLGGGVDLLMAAEEAPGARWPDLAHARGRLPVRPLLAALPVSAGVSVLSHARGRGGSAESGPAPQAVAAVLDSLRRGVSLVVVDLARHLDSGVHAVLDVATLVVIVVPAEVRAAAAAAQVAAGVAGRVVDVRLVVRGPAPSGLPAEAIAEQVGLPLQGWLPAEPGLAEALDRGDLPARSGRGPLARACRQLLDDLLPAHAVTVMA